MKKLFQNKKVVIMGLGLHGGGVGVAKFFLSQGANVLVTDLKTKTQLKESLNKICARPSQARPSLVLYHFDCYRINKAKEILDLGFEEIISNPNNIVVIEWAERVKKILPKNTLWITFKFINEDKREITF